MASWTILPTEIRLSILECLADEKPTPTFTEPGTGQYYWAPYAAVSHAWREFFERRTFASIALFSHDIRQFCDVVARFPERLTYIRRLRFTIDLPEYGCDQCVLDEDAATVKRNNVIFTRSLWPLLQALAAWKPPRPDEPQPNMRTDAMFRAEKLNAAVGIQLELGVRSVSDGQHSFLDYRIQQPYAHIYDFDDFCAYLRAVIAGPQRNSTAHGWTFGRRTRPPSLGAARRVLGACPLELDADGLDSEQTEVSSSAKAAAAAAAAAAEMEMTKRGQRYQIQRKPPVAAIVQKLVLGRRFYRSVHPATILHLLRNCLPQVRYMHLEPWRPVRDVDMDALERGYCLLLANLPSSLEHLHVQVAHSYGTVHHHVHQLIYRRPNPRLGRVLAGSSTRHLVLINFSFLVEADDFFAAAAALPPTAAWPRLEQIALTSRTLALTSSSAAIENLLVDAAAAAAHMPQLRHLDIWNSGISMSARFCFDTTATGVAVICLRASWNPPPVITAKAACAWASMNRSKFQGLPPPDLCVLRVLCVPPHGPSPGTSSSSSSGSSSSWSQSADDQRIFALADQGLRSKFFFEQSVRDIRLENYVHTFM